MILVNQIWMVATIIWQTGCNATCCYVILLSLKGFAILSYAAATSCSAAPDVLSHLAKPGCKRGVWGEGPAGAGSPQSCSARLDLWQRSPWRAPVPHDLRASVRRPERNDGIAIRIQGIRVLRMEHPIKITWSIILTGNYSSRIIAKHEAHSLVRVNMRISLRDIRIARGCVYSKDAHGPVPLISLHEGFCASILKSHEDSQSSVKLHTIWAKGPES